MGILPTDIQLIDLIKQTFGYQTDVELAGFLEVNKDTISAIRHSRTAVGEGLRFTILDKVLVLDKITYRKIEDAIFGDLEGEHQLPRARPIKPHVFEPSSLAEACSPRMLIIRLRQWRWDVRKAQDDQSALSEFEGGPAASEDAELLDLYKEYRQINTDAALAKALGIKRNSISMVRHGHSRFGPLPRLRIYRDVFGRETAMLEAALGSSAILLKLLRQRSLADSPTGDTGSEPDSA